MNVKSTWKNGDTFDIYDDYARIKENIQEVYKLSKEFYPSYDIITLGTYDYSFIPLADFFNDIVKAIQTIYDNSYKSSLYNGDMKTYVGNGLAYDENDLNLIELNIYYLYCTLQGRKNLWNLCGYETLGMKGGDF